MFGRGFRLSSALCVACMMLPSGSMNWGPLLIGCLLLHGLFTLIFLCVAPLSAMPYCSRLVGGLPLHAVLVFPKLATFSKLSSLLVPFKLLVGNHSHQKTCGKPDMLPPILIVAVASALWPGILFLQSAPAWPTTTWIQQ